MVKDRVNMDNMEKLNIDSLMDKQKNRSLKQAFNELRQARMQYEYHNDNDIKPEKPKKAKKEKEEKPKDYKVYYKSSIKEEKRKLKEEKRAKAINQDKLTFTEWIKYRLHKLRYDKQEIKKLSFITAGVFALCITVVSTNYIFAKSQKEEEIKQKIATNVFETNSEALNLQKIIIKNVEVTESKTIVEDEEREIPFNVERRENPNLPLGEEQISTEGQFGKKLVNAVKSYQDDTYIEEKILKQTVTQEPVTEIIEVGTSEYLARLQVHIGENMYVTKTISLKEKAEDNAENLCIILDTLDVKLEELAGDWCKVSYQNYTGYVKNENLTSEAVTPGIGEKSRTQKLYATLDANMDLTKPSGLTLEDYKKILSGNPSDTNKIIENNAENFYNAEQKYGVNGIFLASMAIHESAWGTSKIAKDKKNLFGFGAYDRSPYESANSFDDYSKCIDTVAKYLAKNYLYPAGTKLKGVVPTTVTPSASTNTTNNTSANNTNTSSNTTNSTSANTSINTNTITTSNTNTATNTTRTTTQVETGKATGTYYNGPTIAGVNTRYCTDKEWATKIFKYMDMLYSKI